MNRLQVYPTSRALRSVAHTYRDTEGFIPTLMRMDEFEKRAVLLEEKCIVDPLQRILLLKKAASFDAFSQMKIDRELVRFFTKSDALFKFFEELSAEHVSLAQLAQADAYAEFDTHLAILDELRSRYKALLDEKGFTDRMFIPEAYTLNSGFVEGYEVIEIFLEGYLSMFELELLQKIAVHTEVIIHYTASRFTRKMQERFAGLGIELRENEQVSFSLKDANVLTQIPYNPPINADVYRVEERDAQVALAFVQIERMVRAGISPEEIVLILPDESFKSHFMIFDHLNNLNFAMGYDYANERVFRSLDAIYGFWQKRDKQSRELLSYYGLDEEKITALPVADTVSAQTFFDLLSGMELLETDKHEIVREKYEHIMTLFKDEKFSYRIWLFLWLKTLSKVTLDDVRGGKITVMGVLETRGVAFKGVVIVDFNEGIVPASSAKDMFLNSSVRAFAKLPTRHDREALQKQYYNRLLQQAEDAVIIYSSSENRLPSRFLYELGMGEAKESDVPLEVLYPQPVKLQTEEDPYVKDFDATAQTWSASRLKTFLECKRKYYYRYIKKLEAKEEDELNEGAFLHTLLEHLYQEHDRYEDENTLQNTLDRLMDQLLPYEDAANHYRKLLWKEKLKGFVAQEIAHFRSDWRVIAKEMEVSGEIGGLKFKGRIDRIDQNNTHTLVLDYKSGYVPKEPRELKPETLTDFQMNIYHTLLKERFQNIDMAYVKILEKGEKQFVTRMEERNAILAEHIVTLKQTEAFTAQRCESLQPCRYCEFALMCGRGEYL